MSSITTVWQRLHAVSSLQFISQSRTGIGWQGEGAGQVLVSASIDETLVFTESGSWRQDGGKEIRFSNVFRWTLDGETIRLEHLRFGAANPVFLFEMASDEDGIWHEVNPHPCRDDCYTATMRLDDEQIFVNWLVRGAKRDESINYIYR